MKSALLIIDVQKYYLNEFTKDIPAKLVSYIEKSDFDFIIFSKFVNHENSNVARVFGWKKMQGPPETDICDELRKYAKENNVFEKDTYSLFQSESFRKYLEENNISNLFICGFDTDACVLATSYEGFDRGFRVEVVEDLTVSSIGQQYRGSGLMIIKRRIQPRL